MFRAQTRFRNQFSSKATELTSACHYTGLIHRSVLVIVSVLLSSIVEIVNLKLLESIPFAECPPSSLGPGDR